jgi:ABC-type transporter Mla subunit MlaD
MFVACATSAPDRAAKAASSLDVMQQNSSRARAQIDTVLSSLDTMLNAPADRLRETYDRFDKDVKKMNEYADAIRENDTDLRKNGNTYLAKWQSDASNISDPELRALAEQRRAQIAQSSQSMRSTLTSAAGSFEAFLRDINDIQKVIGNDLTPTGQANVRQTAVAQTAASNGGRAKIAIRDAEQAIENLRSQITPAN